MGSGRKMATGMAGITLGDPIGELVGSSRLRSLLATCIKGQGLAGGGVSLITHSPKATRIRLTIELAGTGFALSVPVPQLFPGQLAPVAGRASLKPLSVASRLPPPCVELGR